MSDILIELTDTWIIKHLGKDVLLWLTGEEYQLIEQFLVETGRV